MPHRGTFRIQQGCEFIEGLLSIDLTLVEPLSDVFRPFSDGEHVGGY